MRPLVVGLVGTDHHRFDRFVGWLDDVARAHPELDVLVQHGTSRAPVVAQGHPYFPHARLVDLLNRASVVVCHGGPATIMDARHLGHVPLCVPRDPALGEHVDDHQLRFAALVGQAGVVHTVTEAGRLETALVERLAGRVHHRTVGPPTTPATEQARARLFAQLDDLAGATAGPEASSDPGSGAGSDSGTTARGSRPGSAA